MNNTLRLLTLSVCITNLIACTSAYQSPYTNYPAYSYDETRYYNQVYEGNMDYSYQSRPQTDVTVPETYHVGASHSPVSHKDRDRTWVNSQNPQSYTIEIADDEKASQVAGKLYKAPKSERMGEIKYNRNGKAYYKGLYGSYNNYDDAQKALNSLPEDVKQGAGIKNWGSVQSSVNN